MRRRATPHKQQCQHCEPEKALSASAGITLPNNENKTKNKITADEVGFNQRYTIHEQRTTLKLTIGQFE